MRAIERPCPCGDCGADLWRRATEAEADALAAEVGLPNRALGRVLAFFWTCPLCANGAVVMLGADGSIAV